MDRNALILHHHDPSPFAEKIRVAFGIKRLDWYSVRIPLTPPKPDLLALTGGYRGTPVLQIGADIYCDTRLIVAEIERRFPSPPLLRSGPLVNFGLQHWSDDAVFPPGSALAMYEGAAAMPQELIADRARYFSNLDFTRFGEDAGHFHAQIAAHAALIDSQLSDGRAYLLGDTPEWADIGAYFPLWMLRGHVPSASALLADRPGVAAWYERIAGFGTGTRTEIDADVALALARSTPLPALSAGELVTVAPVLHPGDAVSGLLASITDEVVTLRRSDPRAGEVAVHFPTIGYRVTRQLSSTA